MTRKMMWFLMAAIAALVLAPVTFAQGGPRGVGSDRLGRRGRGARSGNHRGGLRSWPGPRDSGWLRRHGAESGRERPDPYRVHHRRGADRIADAVRAGHRSDQVAFRSARDGIGPGARWLRASGFFFLGEQGGRLINAALQGPGLSRAIAPRGHVRPQLRSERVPR